MRILGRYSVDERYGAAVTVKRMRVAAEHEYELGDLTEAPPVPYEQMAADLDALIETIQRPHLRALLGRLIDRGTETGAAYHSAPAAKYYHQAYRPRAARALPLRGAGRERARRRPPRAGPRPRRDRRASPRHRQDRGLRQHEQAPIELTDTGKLLGEIPLGYDMVRRED